MDEPGRGTARRDRLFGDIAQKGTLQLRIEDDARTVRADDDVDPGIMLLRADVEPAAPDESVAGDENQVQEHLQRRLAHRGLVDHPAELDPAVAAEQALDRHARLARVDLVAEAPGRAE